MFDLIADEPAAAPIFAAASRELGGRDVRDIVRQGGEAIHGNNVAQLLCCTATLAAWAVISPSVPRPLVIAGYSAGELPAWAVAGLVDAPTAFDLVTQRAALMDDETHQLSGLAAIVGLSRGSIDSLCSTYGLDVAIINGPTHFIVGGGASGIDSALTEARQRGASHAVRLPIQVASHTPALTAASRQFLDVLRERVPADVGVPAGIRLIGGVDGAPVGDTAKGVIRLAAQISTTVNWAACMEACRAARPSHVLELGPGNALARMMSEAAPDIPSRSVADFKSVSGIDQWLATVRRL
ncbi:[acyl-carrier-protein] S-malonyltransferase [Ancylobacter sp. 3268]|nr:[acyl-carrier-protein] S-malonyltransferase [Ancylobacter sp. 3268]